MLRFRGRPREPPGTPTGSKTLIFMGRLFKIEGRPFDVGMLSGLVFDAKMEPTLTSKSTNKCLKTHLESRSALGAPISPWVRLFRLGCANFPLGAICQAFMHPRGNRRSQGEIGITIPVSFWVPPGGRFGTSLGHKTTTTTTFVLRYLSRFYYVFP